MGSASSDSYFVDADPWTHKFGARAVVEVLIRTSQAAAGSRQTLKPSGDDVSAFAETFAQVHSATPGAALEAPTDAEAVARCGLVE